MTLLRRTLLVVGLTGTLVAVGGAGARAAESADDCVALQRTEDPAGLTFEVKNNCDRRLACSLAWRLTCENASGKVTSSARQSASFGVAAAADQKVFGSAKACRDGWRIDDVSWECAPASK